MSKVVKFTLSIFLHYFFCTIFWFTRFMRSKSESCFRRPTLKKYKLFANHGVIRVILEWHHVNKFHRITPILSKFKFMWSINCLCNARLTYISIFAKTNIDLCQFFFWKGIPIYWKWIWKLNASNGSVNILKLLTKEYTTNVVY